MHADKRGPDGGALHQLCNLDGGSPGCPADRYYVAIPTADGVCL